MRRVEVREILKRHDGSLSQIAASLNPRVSAQSVSLVLKGLSKSRRIFAACEAKARELLKQEASSEAA